jgi:SnoaL-like domain
VAGREAVSEERIRESLEAFSPEGLDAWFERFTTPDVVWDLEPLGLGVYEGRAAYREFVMDWVSSYDDWSMRLETIEETGPGFAMSTVVQGGRMRGSDQSVELRWVLLGLWRGGCLYRVINCPDLETARQHAAEFGLRD